ncbi:S-adenosyl-L-methionine-dependent methyltransferase [Bisporella sp. PMI_857]|nr:S-adenosyl-L-methionine-dependent methyltransferase [Bisporella sp. PMI_857]
MTILPLRTINPRTAGRLLGGNSLICAGCTRRLSSRTKIKENDVVLLKHDGKNAFITLSKPLLPNEKIKFEGTKHHVDANDVIGKNVLDTVQQVGRSHITYRIHRPTLAQYCDLTPRLVTPIYSQDASLIVSLLDLHPIQPSLSDHARSRLSDAEYAKFEKYMPDTLRTREDDGVFEIFEAGTGHGALTLHLAQAIHSANPLAPIIPDKVKMTSVSISENEPTTLTQTPIEERQSREQEPINGRQDIIIPIGATNQSHETQEILATRRVAAKPGEGYMLNLNNSSEEERQTAERMKQQGGANRPAQTITGSQQEEQYARYLSNRRAIVHTLDNSAAHSNFARKVVRNYNRGIYYPCIDFHVGTIPDYLSRRLSATGGMPFLAHAILDIPATELYLNIVGQSLKPGGILITWNPSVTQIIKCSGEVRNQSLPFVLEKVVEVGKGVGVGGREWDIRAVVPRATIATNEKSAGNKASDPQGGSVEQGISPAMDDTPMEWICRPKVGLRTEGGGFVGVWRRKSPPPPSRHELRVKSL